MLGGMAACGHSFLTFQLHRAPHALARKAVNLANFRAVAAARPPAALKDTKMPVLSVSMGSLIVTPVLSLAEGLFGALKTRKWSLIA